MAKTGWVDKATRERLARIEGRRRYLDYRQAQLGPVMPVVTFPAETLAAEIFRFVRELPAGRVVDRVWVQGFQLHLRIGYS